MKNLVRSLISKGTALCVWMLAASFCFSADTQAGAAKKPPKKEKVKAKLHKNADAQQSNVKLVEVTGSRLKYRVKEGEEKTATPLTVTVLDPKSPINRGYASPMEMLTKVPSVYRGR